jgi:hypothetical protein
MDELLFPAYKQQKIQPVFIIGLPRSGTTFLHRSLDADQDTFLAVSYFEWAYPYIFFLKLFRFLGLEDRFKNMRYQANTEEGKISYKMHEMGPFTLEEDAFFLKDHFLYGYAVSYQFPYPSLLPYLTDFPSLPEEIQQHMLRTQQKVIKKILYLRGTDKIYLSKHIDNDVRMKLIQLYSDARFIGLFRPINDVLSSWIIGFKLGTIDSQSFDPSQVPGWENGHINTIQTNSSRVMEDLEKQIAPEKQLRLSYEQLTKNIVSTVKYIYTWLGLDMSKEYLQYLEQLEIAQKNRKRGYNYEKRQFEGFEKLNDFILKIDQAHRDALDTLDSKSLIR